MGCPSRAMISWAMTFMHSWGVCSDLRMNNFLRITKKMARCYGKYMIKLTRISDQDDIEDTCHVFVGILPPVPVAVFSVRVSSLLSLSAILTTPIFFDRCYQSRSPSFLVLPSVCFFSGT